MTTIKTRQHQCGFCGVDLNRKSRAKEHVLRRSWLARLSHSKTILFANLMSTAGLVASREFPADQFLAGEVCAACNNGWMNHLDTSVERILMPVIDDHQKIVDITRKDAGLLARWLLKTAIAHELTDKPERRHIPKATRRNVRRADWLPTGMAVFTCVPNKPQQGLGIASLDVWPSDSLDLIRTVPQSRRMKFAVHYNNLIIGCCIFQGKGRTSFLGVGGLHSPILKFGADFDLDWSSASTELMHTVWNDEGIGNSPVNLALATIRVKTPTAI